MTLEMRYGEIQERAVMLDPMSLSHVDPALARGVDQIPRSATRSVDTTLEDSFPASDPPSWMPGMARPAPAGDVSDVKEEPGWITSSDTSRHSS